MIKIELGFRTTVGLIGIVLLPESVDATHLQQVSHGDEEIYFETFSIAGIDPVTGEAGVAVTTRRPCVGNGVPWVRAGVGAVATQASTRVAYGEELLDLVEAGEPPQQALQRALNADSLAARRQIGVIAVDGRSAQHTGSRTNPWTGHRSGQNYATQGNGLVGPQVLEAVAANFEDTEASSRHLADRLIEALAAGHRTGGDARRGRIQSAAVVVADPRPGRSRRPDGITANINVCEHSDPVRELRRIYHTVSQTLGYRTLQEFDGADVLQLVIILRALGYLESNGQGASDSQSERYGREIVDAVDAFRADEGLTIFPRAAPGFVDQEVVERLWAALDRAGKTEDVQTAIRALTAVRR
jgi:uncharacterized Ntn-hydrolase superfamily protein